MIVVGPYGPVQEPFAKEFAMTNVDTGKIVLLKVVGADFPEIEFQTTELVAADYGSPALRLWNNDSETMVEINAVGDPPELEFT